MRKMKFDGRNGSGLRFGMIAVLALSMLAVGCQKNGTPRSAVQPGTAPAREPMNLSAQTGVPMGPVAASFNHIDYSAEKEFTYRSDPFALLPEERLFDFDQHAERLVSTNNWSLEVTPSLDMDEDPLPVVQPLPNWRLAGIIVSNGVLALLDMGGGRVMEIRPGTEIPGTGWRVVSIDEDRAILERDGNVLPNQMEVELTGPIGGVAAPAGGGGGPTGQGAPGGRNPQGINRGGPAGAGGGAGLGVVKDGGK